MASITRASIPPAVLSIAARLREAGFGAWIVGGCVRDLLRGEPVSDWDLATSALPTDVQKLFRRTVPTGIKHGTVTVMEGREGFEVTTLRGESAYSDGRRPDAVSFVGSIEEDLGRRDFTLNAIAFDPIDERVVDPWGGQADLEIGLLRAVRDPMERFAEDGLRVLRAARFVATMALTLEPLTEAAIRPNLPTFAKVSRERVLAEWDKTMRKAAQPSRAFEVMRRTGMLESTAPLLDAQDEATFGRGMRRMDAMPPAFLPRLTALCLEMDDTKALDAWLLGLKTSNEDRAAVLHLVRTFRSGPLEDVLALRAWLRLVGRENIERALSLRGIDADARGIESDVPRLRARIDAELTTTLPLALSELELTGQDLLNELALTPGKHIGEILKGLYLHTLAHPEDNERTRLLELARVAPATVLALSREKRLASEERGD